MHVSSDSRGLKILLAFNAGGVVVAVVLIDH